MRSSLTPGPCTDPNRSSRMAQMEVATCIKRNESCRMQLPLVCESDWGTIFSPCEPCPIHMALGKRRSPRTMAATTALREALNQGISSGSLIDTKIILYSHRDPSGRICRPKPLYANSHVLKKVPYFKDRECAPIFNILEESHGTVLESALWELLRVTVKGLQGSN
jgi:hypothetical protein